MLAGSEICDKCTDPDHQNVLLFETVTSQERFEVVAVVLQAL